MTDLIKSLIPDRFHTVVGVIFLAFRLFF
ncbi:hypothetical protein SEA_JFLIX2_64 [Rhodococcus phage Jflix2]|nr:hypothetical protein SEA_JFLIX2_64 [Rhodococcus phage Jflix2]